MKNLLKKLLSPHAARKAQRVRMDDLERWNTELHAMLKARATASESRIAYYRNAAISAQNELTSLRTDVQVLAHSLQEACNLLRICKDAIKFLGVHEIPEDIGVEYTATGQRVGPDSPATPEEATGGYPGTDTASGSPGTC